MSAGDGLQGDSLLPSCLPTTMVTSCGSLRSTPERKGRLLLLSDQLQKSGEPAVAITQRWLVKPTLHCVTLDTAPPDVKLYSVEAKPPTQSLPHHAPLPQNPVGLQ
jgi:hypothetical protein